LRQSDAAIDDPEDFNMLTFKPYYASDQGREDDMFSLGVMVYFLLSGGGQPWTTLKAYKERRPSQLKVFGYGDYEIENSLQYIISHCLCEDPKHRPSAIDELSIELKHLSLQFHIYELDQDTAISLIQ